MTNWTEAQIDRHLHLWEHRHGPDSPEAGIVRQLRAERDKARLALAPFAFFDDDDPSEDTQSAWEMRYRDTFKDWIDFEDIVAARAALPTTQETPHD